MTTLTRSTQTVVGPDGYEYLCHVLQWGDIAIADDSHVRWGNTGRWRNWVFLVSTDRLQAEWSKPQFEEYGGRFVACLDAELEHSIQMLPSVNCDLSIWESLHTELVGQIAHLWIDAHGLLYAEICTGCIKLLYRDGNDEYYTWTRSAHHGEAPIVIEGRKLIHWQPETMLLSDPVGHVSQLAQVEGGTDLDTNLDMDVWGDALR